MKLLYKRRNHVNYGSIVLDVFPFHLFTLYITWTGIIVTYNTRSRVWKLWCWCVKWTEIPITMLYGNPDWWLSVLSLDFLYKFTVVSLRQSFYIRLFSTFRKMDLRSLLFDIPFFCLFLGCLIFSEFSYRWSTLKLGLWMRYFFLYIYSIDPFNLIIDP